ncbi:MAG: hypothetical protein ABEJ72_10930, partial [Candidatus Aenigmatarchaeota archaeon]
MTYVYRLAGDNLELAEAELNGFLEAVEAGEEAERKEKLAFTGAHPGQLRRLALVHEVSELISRDKEIDYRPEASFAVRAEDFTESSNTKDLEQE